MREWWLVSTSYAEDEPIEIVNGPIEVGCSFYDGYNATRAHAAKVWHVIEKPAYDKLSKALDVATGVLNKISSINDYCHLCNKDEHAKDALQKISELLK